MTVHSEEVDVNVKNVEMFVMEKHEVLTKKMTREHIFIFAFLTLLINAPFMILGVFRIASLTWLALFSIYTFWVIITARVEERSIQRTLLYWGSFSFYLSLLALSACVKMLILSGNVIVLPLLILITVLNVIVSVKVMNRRVTSHYFKQRTNKKRILSGATGSTCCIAAYFLTRLVIPRLNLSPSEILHHLFILALLISQMSLHRACTFFYRAYLTRKYCPDIKSDCEENA